jgi:hypothetical protein
VASLDQSKIRCSGFFWLSGILARIAKTLASLPDGQTGVGVNETLNRTRLVDRAVEDGWDHWNRLIALPHGQVERASPRSA